MSIIISVALHVGKKVIPTSANWEGRKWSWQQLQTDWKDFKAGDILLISYRQGAINRFAGAANSGFWDHIAMVIHGFDRSTWQIDPTTEDPLAVDRANALGKGPQLLESTKLGVHAYDLLDRITDFGCHKYKRVAYCVRRLKGIERTPEFYKKVEDLCRKVLGTPYPNFFKMSSAGFRWNAREDYSDMMCSELVAMFYENLALIPTHLHTNNFMPGDFSTDGRETEYKIDTLMKQRIDSEAYLSEQELIVYKGQNKEHDNRKRLGNRKK